MNTAYRNISVAPGALGNEASIERMRAAHGTPVVDVDVALASAWRTGAHLHRLNQRFLERARKIPNITGLPEMETIPAEQAVRVACLREINQSVQRGLSTIMAAAVLENYVMFLDGLVSAVVDYLNERVDQVLFSGSLIFLNKFVRDDGRNQTSRRLERELKRHCPRIGLVERLILDESWTAIFQHLAYCTTDENATGPHSGG